MWWSWSTRVLTHNVAYSVEGSCLAVVCGAERACALPWQTWRFQLKIHPNKVYLFGYVQKDKLLSHSMLMTAGLTDEELQRLYDA